MTFDRDALWRKQCQLNDDLRLEREMAAGAPVTLEHIAALNRLCAAREVLRSEQAVTARVIKYIDFVNDPIAQEYQRALDRIVVESLIRSTPGVKL